MMNYFGKRENRITGYVKDFVKDWLSKTAEKYDTSESRIIEWSIIERIKEEKKNGK